ncbi:MAG: vWA domain-containing protein [bacterium]
MKIFYIARCLFSSNSSFPIKGHFAPLLERKEIFSNDCIKKENEKSETIVKSNMSESVDIGRINSVHQISHILPREFITNLEEVFYKKLMNRELFKKEFNTPDGYSVSELVNGRESELNRKQKIYILLDNSYSMNGEKFNKIFTAKAICLEYLKNVQRENPQIYFRYFNQAMGPLLRIRKSGEIKDLIKYIMDLNTFECYETKISEAILKAAEDIRTDPEFKQAEILIITDGLADIPPNMEERLGNIKLHCILISGADISHFLDLYPDEVLWAKSNPEMGSKKMPSFWETFLKITQVYRLQDVADIFIRIPSSSLEDIKFFDSGELDLMEETRLNLSKKLTDEISNEERYTIFQKIKFITKYLKIMLSKAPSPELRKRIKKEISGYDNLIKKIMENKWFAYTLDSQIKLTRKENNEPMLYMSGDSKKQCLIFFLLKSIMRNLMALPGQMAKGTRFLIRAANAMLCSGLRKYRLRRRFSYINNLMSKITFT